jgi:hypothetical protein
LESRLDAMDRRLRQLQEELAAGPPVSLDGQLGSPSGAFAAELSDAESDRSPTQVEVLAKLYGRLVASMRELLGGYELVAEQLVHGRASPPLSAAPEHGSTRIALSAGPFAGTAVLRDFERALSELPGVQAVALRGYEADNRAIIDVRLR